MADNLKIRQPADPRQINIHEPWEVEYWTKKWNISRSRLEEAVRAVGTQTAKVAQYLGKAV